MGIFTKLFGPKAPSRPPRDVAALASHLAQPSLQLQAGLPVRAGAPVHSWFRGAPDLAPGVSHPVRNGRSVAHIATIDLAQAQAAGAIDWLPATGSIAFFYDEKAAPYGNPEDRDGWRVLYRPERANSRSPESLPIRMRQILTYPPPERSEVEALELDDAELDLYSNLEHGQTGLEYCHKLGGFQSLIQADRLEEECEAAIRGGKGLADGESDWRLLLQLSTDDRIDFTFGDAGNLYYMIREADARAGKFENVWLIGECF